jgi:chemotaxis protein methyltransferase WspC
MKPEDWLAAIAAMLRDLLGFDAASIGTAAVYGSIRSAYLESGFDRPLAFLSALEHDPERRQALIARVVVPETWLFRDETPFSFLQRHASQWARRHPAGRLRVLSAPCASGEEAYSIAISLAEAGLAPARFAVDAVDVSEPLLERARRGMVPASAFRTSSALLKDRYFSPRDGGFVLDEGLRASLTFERRNLVAPDLRFPAPHYDVVFCRNLLIYLHREARQALVRHLSQCLSADGVLVVGHAEVLPMCAGGAFRVADGRAFALVRAPHASRRREPAALPAVRAPMPAPPPPQVSSNGDHLERARLLADRGELDEARALCRRALADRGPSDGIYFLLGVIEYAAGRHREGTEALRKALYLNPTHREALLQLATHHERCGDRSSAERLRRRAGDAAE